MDSGMSDSGISSTAMNYFYLKWRQKHMKTDSVKIPEVNHYGTSHRPQKFLQPELITYRDEMTCTLMRIKQFNTHFTNFVESHDLTFYLFCTTLLHSFIHFISIRSFIYGELRDSPLRWL